MYALLIYSEDSEFYLFEDVQQKQLDFWGNSLFRLARFLLNENDLVDVRVKLVVLLREYKNLTVLKYI